MVSQVSDVAHGPLVSTFGVNVHAKFIKGRKIATGFTDF